LRDVLYLEMLLEISAILTSDVTSGPLAGAMTVERLLQRLQSRGEGAVVLVPVGGVVVVGLPLLLLLPPPVLALLLLLGKGAA
jgi:hypothetical protein